MTPPPSGVLERKENMAFVGVPQEVMCVGYGNFGGLLMAVSGIRNGNSD